jgi:hypothetical protein
MSHFPESDCRKNKKQVLYIFSIQRATKIITVSFMVQGAGAWQIAESWILQK